MELFFSFEMYWPAGGPVRLEGNKKFFSEEKQAAFQQGATDDCEIACGGLKMLWWRASALPTGSRKAKPLREEVYFESSISRAER